MPKKKIITNADMARGEQPWRLPEWDHQQRLAAQGELSRLIDAEDLPVFAGSSSQAVRGWWQSVVTNRLDPYEMALLWFGATREQLDALIAACEPLGLAIQRVMVAQSLREKERVSEVEDKLYRAALEDSPSDRKLFLTANKPEKYSDKSRVEHTGTVTVKAYVGIDVEEV